MRVPMPWEYCEWHGGVAAVKESVCTHTFNRQRPPQIGSAANNGDYYGSGDGIGSQTLSVATLFTNQDPGYKYNCYR
jgi:hypothetical protein